MMKKISNKPSQSNDDETTVDPVAGKNVAEIFGEITWLMSQHAEAKELAIKDLEQCIMPAILLRQFHIQYARIANNVADLEEARKSANASYEQQNLQPVSVEVFAMCSDAVNAALEANPDITLTLQDWRSGPHKRVLASYSIADQMKIIS